MKRFRSLISGFLEPAECALCSDIAEPHVRVCQSCIRSLAETRPLVHPFAAEAGLSFGSRVIALGPYTGILERAVIALKRGSPGLLISILASRLRDVLADAGDSYQVVTWVPGSIQRIRREGFDHGRVLARELAAGLRVQCRPMLHRDPGARVQHGLDADGRRANASIAFKADTPGDSVTGNHMVRGRILVVDDVMTTGASLEACVRLLGGGTGSGVDGAVIARADRELVC